MNKILIGILLVILVFLGSSFAIYARQCQKDIESALDEINSFWTITDRIMELYQNGTHAYDRYIAEVEAHSNDESFDAGLVRSSLESAASWYEKGGRLEQEAVDKAAEILSFLEELRENGCLDWTDYKDAVKLLRTSIENYKGAPHDYISSLRRQAYNKYIAAAEMRSASWSYYYIDYDRFKDMWYRANALRQEGIDLHHQFSKINEQEEESFDNGIIPALEEIEELLLQEDLQPPITSHAFQGTNPGNLSISFEARDSGSGVRKTEYRTDSDRTWRSTTGAGVQLSLSKITTIQYRSTDKVGNKEAVNTIHINHLSSEGTFRKCPKYHDSSLSGSFEEWYPYNLSITVHYYRIFGDNQKPIVFIDKIEANLQLQGHLPPDDPYSDVRYLHIENFDIVGQMEGQIVTLDPSGGWDSSWSEYTASVEVHDLNGIHWQKPYMSYSVIAHLYLKNNRRFTLRALRLDEFAIPFPTGVIKFAKGLNHMLFKVTLKSPYWNVSRRIGVVCQ